MSDVRGPQPAGASPLTAGRESAPAYTLTARLLHWLTAAIVLTMIPVGITMLRVSGGPLQNWLFDFHRSLGVLLFLVVAIRLAWRLTHPPRPLPDDIPALQRGVAQIVHGLLYLILLVQPIVGWIGTSAFGAPIFVFGLFELPPIVERNRPLADTVLGLHDVLGWSLLALIVGHAGAALYHHFVRRDGVLLRMTGGA